MTLRLTLLAVIAAALALPASASAGGWATVGLEPPPDGLEAGEPWRVDLTILQHGQTPLEGVKPRVNVAREDGSARSSFPARATGEPGVYRATVVFESAGEWAYVVDDGFTGQHSFKPVQVVADGKGRTTEAVALANAAAAVPPPDATGGDDGPDWLLAALGAAVAALVAGGGMALLQRRRGGPGPASSA
jgi:YtkA-like